MHPKFLQKKKKKHQGAVSPRDEHFNYIASAWKRLWKTKTVKASVGDHACWSDGYQAVVIYI